MKIEEAKLTSCTHREDGGFLYEGVIVKAWLKGCTSTVNAKRIIFLLIHILVVDE